MKDFTVRNQWPILSPGIESRYFSSFDRTGGNNDGFEGTYSALYVDENGQHVIFDAEGPGCLRTLWFTSEIGGNAPLSLGLIRFYFDGEEEPRIEIDANDLYSGSATPFLHPLVANNTISTGGFASWVPLPYRSSLKITTENRAFFYIAQYDTYPCDTELDTWAKGDYDQALTDEFLQAGEPFSLPRSKITSGEGSGVIDRVAFVPSAITSKETLQNSRIRIWWDGQEEPAIDCPVGVFFGTGLGPVALRAIAFQSDGKAFVNCFPMPFWSSYRIEVDGIAGQLLVDIGVQRYKKAESGYFCATYRKEHPTTLGKDFVMLETGGAGKLVGTVLVVEPPTPADKQWWEGDLRSYTNGKRTPNMHGTGHEDDHLGGWSNEFLETPYTLPMHGEPAVEMLDWNGQYNGNCSLYRLWPGICFEDGISHSVEHGTENVKNYNYSSVAFWYRNEPYLLVKTDSVYVADAESRAIHSLTCQNESEAFELASTFEGCHYQVEYKAKHICHLNAMEFTARINPANKGVFLRRSYDQFHGRQRARVLVDGEYAGTWYTAEENRHSRWAERDFFIPEKLTIGKDEIKIEIDPPAGSPLWSVSAYGVFCIIHPAE